MSGYVTADMRAGDGWKLPEGGDAIGEAARLRSLPDLLRSLDRSLGVHDESNVGVEIHGAEECNHDATDHPQPEDGLPRSGRGLVLGSAERGDGEQECSEANDEEQCGQEDRLEPQRVRYCDGRVTLAPQAPDARTRSRMSSATMTSPTPAASAMSRP